MLPCGLGESPMVSRKCAHLENESEVQVYGEYNIIIMHADMLVCRAL